MRERSGPSTPLSDWRRSGAEERGLWGNLPEIPNLKHAQKGRKKRLREVRITHMWREGMLTDKKAFFIPLLTHVLEGYFIRQVSWGPERRQTKFQGASEATDPKVHLLLWGLVFWHEPYKVHLAEGAWAVAGLSGLKASEEATQSMFLSGRHQSLH